MTENQTPQPEPVAHPILPQPVSPAPPAKTSLMDRVLSMRAVAGLAAASLILGGAGGAVLGAVSNGGDDHGFRGGPGGMPGGLQGGPQGGSRGLQQPPPGMQGQQPGQPQDDDN